MCLLTTILSFHPLSFQHFNTNPLSQISDICSFFPLHPFYLPCLPVFLFSVFVLLSVCLGQSWQSWRCRNPSVTPHPPFFVQRPSFFCFYNFGPAPGTAQPHHHDNVLRGRGGRKKTRPKSRGVLGFKRWTDTKRRRWAVYHFTQACLHDHSKLICLSSRLGYSKHHLIPSCLPHSFSPPSAWVRLVCLFIHFSSLLSLFTFYKPGRDI